MVKESYIDGRVSLEVNRINIFINRMTVKLQQDSRKSRSIKLMGMSAGDIFANIDATGSIGVKFQIKKVGGKIEFAISSSRNMCFSRKILEEEI